MLICSLEDSVVSFANAAVENVASAIRPCLVIVHNKCGPYEPMDPDEMTKLFLELHSEEGNTLLSLYDSIKCISIPDWYHDQVSNGKKTILLGFELVQLCRISLTSFLGSVR